MTCTVSGVLIDAEGAALPGAAALFTADPPSLRATAGGAEARTEVRVVADADGAISVDLTPGRYDLRVLAADGRLYGPRGLTVPDTASAALSAVIDAAPPPVPGLNAVTVRDLLTDLTGTDRLDASAIKGLSGGAVPAGGTTGQALVKASATDFDTTWATISSGGGDVSISGTPTAGQYAVWSSGTAIGGQAGVPFADLSGTPTTLAGYGITDAATAAQGALAGTAVQPGDLATVATTGAYADLSGLPSLGGAAELNVGTTAGTVAAGDHTHANATTGAAGFMSAADKTKLNGVATGATANAGTVTSVAASGAGGISVTGSPVTASGTLAFNIADAALTIAKTNGLQAALDGKQATLVSGTSIKTINSESILGSGNLSVSVSATDVANASQDWRGSGAETLIAATTALEAAASAGVTDGDKGDIVVSGTGATWTIDTNVVDAAKFRQSAGFSVVGKATTGTGNVADIVAGANGVLRRSGSGDLAFGTLVTANLGDAQVTLAKMASLAQSTIIGRAAAAGTGAPTALTAAQARTILNVADGATANAADATLLARANHTGTQTAATISDFATAVAATAEVTANTAKVSNATHTGDVTGATALTIAAGAVTLAKMADLTQATILGRAAAADTGAPTALTAAQARTILNVADGATSNAGTVTSVAISGAGGITVTSGSPVTSSGTIALNIADGALALAKVADITQATILGRAAAAGTGAPTALTAAQARTILNVADGATANAGTVTSVAISGAGGISVTSGSPITGAGTIAINIADAALTIAKTDGLQAALDAKAPLTPTLNAQTGTAYTLVIGDAGKPVTMNNAAANTLTIPANASVAFPVGTIINLVQTGAGVTTIQGATGVTVNGTSAGSVAIDARWQGAALLKIAADEWVASGALA